MPSNPDEYGGALDRRPRPSPLPGLPEPLETSGTSGGPECLAPGLLDAPEDCPPTAIIDVGSGSARAVVMRVSRGGGAEIIAQQRMNLDLISQVNREGLLESEGVTRTLEAVEDFVKVCLGYGVAAIHAVGTAALRESRNAADVVESVARDFGVSFRVISGYEEAAYCFIGAVHGLPVSQGLMADFGSGSLEAARFAQRSLQAIHSLPLGGLRIANRFRLTCRPTVEDVLAASRYVRECLTAAGIPKLDAKGTLVASGGSMRLLAKLDRQGRRYPIKRLHGYCIDADRLAELAGRLAAATAEERAGMPGMNPERTHSVLGGAVTAQALLEHTGAGGIMVSGQGLREGLARHPQSLPEDGQIRLPSAELVRDEGLADLARRFAPRFWARGPRRADLAHRLAETAWQRKHRSLTSSVQCAALLLDIGSAVDFYNRLDRTAAMVARSDLPGFSHRESAQIAGALVMAQLGRLPGRYRKTSLLSDGDKERLGQAAAILLMADELDRRLPPGCPSESVAVAGDGDGVSVVTPAWSHTSAPGVLRRWEAEFNQPIHVGEGEPWQTISRPQASK